jgi:2-hydroxy-6-oxonona-2,4-dienedioate hydrolase
MGIKSLVFSASRPEARPAPVVEKDATVLGFKMHYLEAGSGSPVVLLHGLGGDGHRWGPNIGPLAANVRVLAVDHIGFGQSDKPLANYHTGMLAEFVVEFLKVIEVRRASFLGNSMGAFVAAYIAVHHPQAVDRIVLVDGADYKRAAAAPAPDLHLEQIQNGVTRDETREFFRMLFYDKSLVTEKLVDENLILRLRSAFAITKMQHASYAGLGGITDDEMRAIKAPTLIVWGRNDELFPVQIAERLHRDISGSQLVVLNNSGHFPQLERADEFNQIVRGFLKGDSVSPNDRL